MHNFLFKINAIKIISNEIYCNNLLFQTKLNEERRVRCFTKFLLLLIYLMGIIHFKSCRPADDMLTNDLVVKYDIVCEKLTDTLILEIYTISKFARFQSKIIFKQCFDCKIKNTI